EGVQPAIAVNVATARITSNFRGEFSVASMSARGNIRCLNVSRNAPVDRLIRTLSRLLVCILPMLASAEPPLINPSTPAALSRTRVLVVEDSAATDAFIAQPETVR